MGLALAAVTYFSGWQDFLNADFINQVFTAQVG